MNREEYRKWMDTIQPSAELVQATKQKMRQPRPAKTLRWVAGAGVACAAVVAAVAVAWPASTPTSPGTMPETAEKTTEPQSTMVQPQDQPTIITALTDGEHQEKVILSNGELYFREEDFMTGARVDWALLGGREEKWTKEQATAYLGRAFQPEYVPEDLQQKEESYYVIVNDMGEILQNLFSASYAAPRDGDYAPLQRKLSIEVAKEEIPLQCGVYLYDSEEISQINGLPVGVGYCQLSYGPYTGEGKTPAGYYDVYVAEFIYEGIGYYIEGRNLTQTEFIQVLQSIIR